MFPGNLKEHDLGEQLTVFLQAVHDAFAGFDVVFPGEVAYWDETKAYADKREWKYCTGTEAREKFTIARDTLPEWCIQDFSIIDKIFLGQIPNATRNDLDYARTHLPFDFHIRFASEEVVRRDPGGYLEYMIIFHPDPLKDETDRSWVERVIRAIARGMIIDNAPHDDDHLTWVRQEVPFTGIYIKALDALEEVSEPLVRDRKPRAHNIVACERFDRLVRARWIMIWLIMYARDLKESVVFRNISYASMGACNGKAVLTNTSIIYECNCSEEDMCEIYPEVCNEHYEDDLRAQWESELVKLTESM